MTSSRIWVGGGTGAGKTTTARALAVKHGLRRFAIDAFWYAYDARWAQPRKSPDEQWLETPPGVQAAEFEEVSRRMMRFALDDLAVLPDVPTVVEGPQILPDLVPPSEDRKSTRLNSSHVKISYAVFCLKKKKKKKTEIVYRKKKKKKNKEA